MLEQSAATNPPNASRKAENEDLYGAAFFLECLQLLGMNMTNAPATDFQVVAGIARENFGLRIGTPSFLESRDDARRLEDQSIDEHLSRLGKEFRKVIVEHPVLQSGFDDEGYF